MNVLVISFMFLTILGYINYINITKLNLNMDLFENKYCNLLYIASYGFPLSIFLKESDELSDKEKKIEEKISKLNLNRFFNLRSFMALRFIFFLSSIVLYLAVLFIMKSLMGDAFAISETFIWLAMLLSISFLPDLYLKKKEKEYEKFYYDEVIVLQLFLILLIKSNSTVENILFSFSKMKTFHKHTFEKAYRISIRNKKEALEYLEKTFEDMRLGNSFNILKSLSEFSREDSIRILKTNLKVMEEENMNSKRKEELTKFSYAQVSVVIPFMIVIFLGAIPFINYGINMMTESIQGL